MREQAGAIVLAPRQVEGRFGRAQLRGGSIHRGPGGKIGAGIEEAGRGACHARDHRARGDGIARLHIHSQHAP
ncbi:MAG: hypothetical protein IPM70_09105 [Proteobacteria bacterium]|nr:hypothetical protein [Pseudomonadota bacterium]